MSAALALPSLSPPPEPASRPGSPWLVSARWDVAVFGGSAALAFALLAWAWRTGTLGEGTPVWTWVATVVAVDVAHVWATLYRVYLDPREMERRPGLYWGVPAAAYVVGVVLHSVSSGLFWRVLAYLAVWHFVRQQYGWVALYRRRMGDASSLDRWIDDAAIYSATLYPLLYWHAHLPREFAWFLQGDFLPGVPPGAARALLPVHLAITAAYVLRQLWRRWAGRPASPGKDLVVGTTWLTWFLGIVVFDSDYAFTVTNVLVHGVPYLAYVHLHGRRRFAGEASAVGSVFRPWRFGLFLAPLLVLAFAEEWGWDRLVWHEHGALFPGPDVVLRPEMLALVVPLLAVPQATHYALDAWIWRVRKDPALAHRLGLDGATAR